MTYHLEHFIDLNVFYKHQLPSSEYCFRYFVKNVVTASGVLQNVPAVQRKIQQTVASDHNQILYCVKEYKDTACSLTSLSTKYRVMVVVTWTLFISA